VRQRFVDSLDLVSLQAHTVQSFLPPAGQAGGMAGGFVAGVYVALAQALVSEQVDVDGSSGLRGWKQICSSYEEQTSHAGSEVDNAPRRPVLEVMAESVGHRVVGRARQLGAAFDTAQQSELPLLSCAADAFNVNIHLLKVAGEIFEEAVLYVLPLPPSSFSLPLSLPPSLPLSLSLSFSLSLSLSPLAPRFLLSLSSLSFYSNSLAA
jgi:hypothetical protein